MKPRQLSVFMLFVGSCLISLGQALPKFEAHLLAHPKEHRLELELEFKLIKTPRFIPTNGEQTVWLPNGFAKAKLSDIRSWNNIGPDQTVTQIDIVCSWWPRNKTKWRPDYHVLLANRVQEVLELDPDLNTEEVIWNLVMQTDCDSREEAEDLFHGVVVTFSSDPIPPVNTGDFVGIVSDQPTNDADPPSPTILEEIAKWSTAADSTVTTVLNRNKDWNNMLVVMDWTSSMYPYGGQAILWQALRSTSGGIKYFVFFNDGDQRFEKPIGHAGGVYYSASADLEDVVATMNRVRSRGNGGDIPENDFEALLKSVNKYDDFDELILIADNNSWVRDFDLIDSLDVPVRTIVCGNYHGINAQYVNLAYRTGGSVHTIEEDIYNLAAKMEDGLVLIENTQYKLTADDLLLPLVENNPNLANDQ